MSTPLLGTLTYLLVGGGGKSGGGRGGWLNVFLLFKYRPILIDEMIITRIADKIKIIVNEEIAPFGISYM